MIIYNISSASKLAEKWNITSQIISNWKANNSINALKKKNQRKFNI